MNAAVKFVPPLVQTQDVVQLTCRNCGWQVNVDACDATATARDHMLKEPQHRVIGANVRTYKLQTETSGGVRS